MAINKENRSQSSATAGDPERQERKTIDGQTVIIVSKREIKRLAGKVLCAGGIGHGCHKLSPHPFIAQSAYDDPSRSLKGVRLEKEQSRQSYFCCHCQKFMGCATCVGDIASLVCNNCRDWANDISLTVHGPMMQDSQLKSYGMKLVEMMAVGKVTEQEFNRLWNDARTGNLKTPDQAVMTMDMSVNRLAREKAIPPVTRAAIEAERTPHVEPRRLESVKKKASLAAFGK